MLSRFSRLSGSMKLDSDVKVFLAVHRDPVISSALTVNNTAVEKGPAGIETSGPLEFAFGPA